MQTQIHVDTLTRLPYPCSPEAQMPPSPLSLCAVRAYVPLLMSLCICVFECMHVFLCMCMRGVISRGNSMTSSLQAIFSSIRNDYSSVTPPPPGSQFSSLSGLSEKATVRERYPLLRFRLPLWMIGCSSLFRPSGVLWRPRTQR